MYTHRFFFKWSIWWEIDISKAILVCTGLAVSEKPTSHKWFITGKVDSCTYVFYPVVSIPNTVCLSRWWLLLGARKSAPKKLKNNFSKMSYIFLKTHAHYVTVFIYLETWRATKPGTLLILRSQTYPDVAKASTH